MSKRLVVLERLKFWSDALYWNTLIIMFAVQSLVLGITIIREAPNFTGVSYHLVQWISPELYLLWGISSVVCAGWTLVRDPYHRLHPVHFAPAMAYLVTGVWMSLQGAFPYNLGVNYGFLLAFQALGWSRTLFGRFEE